MQPDELEQVKRYLGRCPRVYAVVLVCVAVSILGAMMIHLPPSGQIVCAGQAMLFAASAYLHSRTFANMPFLLVMAKAREGSSPEERGIIFRKVHVTGMVIVGVIALLPPTVISFLFPSRLNEITRTPIVFLTIVLGVFIRYAVEVHMFMKAIQRAVVDDSADKGAMQNEQKRVPDTR
jgi:hypothetical protein